MKQWLLIENEKEYKEAISRFEEIREAKKGTSEYREMLLFVHIISEYEKNISAFPKLTPSK